MKFMNNAYSGDAIKMHPIQTGVHRGATARATDQDISPGDTPDSVEDTVMFIFDAHGRTRFCSKPEAFMADRSEVADLAISHLLPDLPFREGTPGYNIAYARLTFSDGEWHRHAIRTADGRMQPADICLKPVPIDRNYCLVGLVRLQKPGLIQCVPGIAHRDMARISGGGADIWQHHAA